MGKQDKRRARAKQKAKARAGSVIAANRPNYRNPQKLMERQQRAAIAQTRREAIAQAQAKEDARECGDCTACCTVLSIPSIEKPAWSRCSHLCDAGCGIYDDRPTECSEYLCFWRQGFGEDEDRPDRLGVVIGFEDNPAFLQAGLGRRGEVNERVVMMRAEDDEAFKREDVMRHVHSLTSRSVVTVLIHGLDGVTVYGPKHPEGLRLERADMDAHNAYLASQKGTDPKSTYGEMLVQVPQELLQDGELS